MTCFTQRCQDIRYSSCESRRETKNQTPPIRGEGSRGERWQSGISRVRFVVRASQGEENFSALCEEFEISRPTGYRWWGPQGHALERFERAAPNQLWQM